MAAIRTSSKYIAPELYNLPSNIRPFGEGSYYYLPKIYTPYRTYNKPTRASMADYNDPTQLNSFVDSLFNIKAINKMSKYDLRTKLPGDKLYGQLLTHLKKVDRPGKLDTADILQSALAPYHVLRTNTVDPIVESWQKNEGMRKLSGFGTAGINTLMNFGETMDVLANPVKGMLFEKEGAGKGFVRGFGFGEDGRYNYDFDINTGLGKAVDIPLNFIGEVLADPFNWATLGSFAVGKIGVKAAKEVLEMSLKKASKELSDEVIERVTNKVLNQVRKNPDDIYSSVDKALKGLSKEFNLDVATRHAAEDASYHAAKEMPLHILRSLNSIAEKSNAIERQLVKGVGVSTGVLPFWKTTKFVADPVTNAIKTRMHNKLRGAVMKDGKISITRLEPLLETKPRRMTRAMTGVDEYAAEAANGLRVAALQTRMEEVYDIARLGHDNMLDELDDLFMRQESLSFTEYVEYVAKLVETHPKLEWHLRDLRTIENVVKYRGAIKTKAKERTLYKDVLKSMRSVQDTVDAYEDLTVFKPGMPTLVALIEEANSKHLPIAYVINKYIKYFGVFDLRNLNITVDSLTELGNKIEHLKHLVSMTGGDEDTMHMLAGYDRLYDRLAELVNIVQEARRGNLYFVNKSLSVDIPELWSFFDELKSITKETHYSGSNKYFETKYQVLVDELKNFEDKAVISFKNSNFFKKLNMGNDKIKNSEATSELLDMLAIKQTSHVMDMDPKAWSQTFSEGDELLKDLESLNLNTLLDYDVDMIKYLWDTFKEDPAQEKYSYVIDVLNDFQMTLDSFEGDLLNTGTRSIKDRYNKSKAIVTRIKRVRDLDKRPDVTYVNLQKGNGFWSWAEEPNIERVEETITEAVDIISGVRKHVTEFLNSLDNSATVYETSAKLLTDVSEYAFKLTQAHANILLLESEAGKALNRLAFDLANNTGYGAILEALKDVPGVSALVEEIKDSAVAHGSYTRMLETLGANDVLEPFLPHIFDTLQTHARTDLVKFTDDASRVRYINRIIKDVEIQIASIQSTRNSLDAMLTTKHPELKEEYSKYAEKMGVDPELTHDAEADVVKTMFALTRNEYALKYYNNVDKEKNLLVVYDIETTGKSPNGHRVLQISFKTFEGHSFNVNVKNIDIYPDFEVMKKHTGKTKYQEVKDAFDNKYKYNTDGVEHYEIVPAFIEALFKLEQDINKVTPGRQLLLAGWNSSEFDDNFIKTIIKNTPAFKDPNLESVMGARKHFFNNLSKVDLLKETNLIQGHTYMPAAAKKSLYDALDAYIGTRDYLESGIGVSKFVDTINGRFAYNIKKLAEELENIKSAKTIRVITAELEKHRMTLPGLITDLHHKANNLMALLGSITEQNIRLNRARIYVNKETGQMYDAKNKELDLPGVTNVVQLFADEVGDKMYYASRLIFENRKVRRIYQNLDKDVVATATERELIYRTAKKLEKLSDGMRHTEYVSKYYEDFKKAGTFFREYAIASMHANNAPLPVAILWLSPDVVGNFDRAAITLYLYEQARKSAVHYGTVAEFDTQVKERLSEELYKLIRNPDPLFTGRDMTYIEDDFTSTFFDLNLTNTARDSKEYRRELEEILENSKDRLRDLNILQDSHSMHAPNAQAGGALLQDMLDNGYNRIWDWLNEAADDAEYADREMVLRWALLQYEEYAGLSSVDHVIRMDANTLEEFLWMNDGRYTFGIPEYAGSDSEVIISSQLKLIKDRAEELKKNNIIVEYNEDANAVVVFLDNVPEVVNKWSAWETDAYKKAHSAAHAHNLKALRTQDKVFAEDIWRKFYKEVAPIMYKDLNVPETIIEGLEYMVQRMADFTGGKNIGTLGDTVSYDVLKTFDNFVAPHIQSRMIPLDVFAKVGHFNTVRFNRSIDGVPQYRRIFNRYASGNILKNYINSTAAMLDIMDNRTKMTQLFFDEMHALKGDLFKGLTRDEIFKMLSAHPEYKLVGLIQDDKFGNVVKEFKVKSVADLNRYLDGPDLHLTVMPSQTYLSAYSYINDFRVGGQGFKHLLNNWLIGPMKTGYLTSLGFVMRNIVDSTVKNILLTGDVTETYSMVKHTLETWRNYKNYKDILKKVLDYNDDTVVNRTGMFSKRILKKLYETQGDELNKIMSQDMFQLFHDFVEQGPSAGLSNLQQELVDKKLKLVRARKGIPEPLDNLATKIMNNPASSMILGVNSELEQVFRLSGYLWELQNGKSVNEAMYSVLKHHFDYSAKSKFEMYAEYVVPFASFSINNLAFWLDSFDKLGWMAGTLRDLYTPIWDFDSRDEELRYNRSLQYHILAGNIPFDNNLVLKLSPSVLDAVRLLTDPTEFLGRIAFYFRVPIDLIINGVQDKDFEDFVKLFVTNIPMVGPTALRYWGVTEYLKENGFENFLSNIAAGKSGFGYDIGSAFKASDRITGVDIHAAAARFAAVVLPSIFGAVAQQREWESDYKIKNIPKAKDIYVKKFYPKKAYTPGKMREPYVAWGRRTYHKKAYHRRPYAKRNYAKRSYAKRSYAKQSYATRSYATRSYASKSYTPRNYDRYVQDRVKYAARGNQMRMPGGYRNVGHTAPSLYRKLYTGTGRARFNSRLLPVTPKNLAGKLRSDWAYLRA